MEKRLRLPSFERVRRGKRKKDALHGHFHTLSVIRIKIPAQKEMSYLDDVVYERQFNDTIKIVSPKMISDF